MLCNINDWITWKRKTFCDQKNYWNQNDPFHYNNLLKSFSFTFYRLFVILVNNLSTYSIIRRHLLYILNGMSTEIGEFYWCYLNILKYFEGKFPVIEWIKDSARLRVISLTCIKGSINATLIICISPHLTQCLNYFFKKRFKHAAQYLVKYSDNRNSKYFTEKKFERELKLREKWVKTCYRILYKHDLKNNDASYVILTRDVL